MKSAALHEPMEVLDKSTREYPGLEFKVQISTEQTSEQTCLSSDLEQL
jgi:hypothetical protein